MFIWLVFFIVTCFLVMVGSYFALMCLMMLINFDDEKEKKKWTRK